MALRLVLVLVLELTGKSEDADEAFAALAPLPTTPEQYAGCRVFNAPWPW